MKPVLLVLISMSEPSLAQLATRFELHHAPTVQQRADDIQTHGARIQVVLTNGTTGLRADEIDAMPQLRLACALGGAATRHLVDAPVLKAIGPSGFLINIARGSVVDTEALAQALRAGELGGAGLDVYESEPLPPAALTDLPNVVLTPHIAGWSP